MGLRMLRLPRTISAVHSAVRVLPLRIFSMSVEQANYSKNESSEDAVHDEDDSLVSCVLVLCSGLPTFLADFGFVQNRNV